MSAGMRYELTNTSNSQNRPAALWGNPLSFYGDLGGCMIRPLYAHVAQVLRQALQHLIQAQATEHILFF